LRQLARKEQEMFVAVPAERAIRAHRRKTFNLSRSKLPALVVVLLLSYLAFTFSSQFSSLSAMQRDIRNMEQEVQELKQKNASLREELQRVQSDSYVEKVAREKLGLVKPGETRVVTVPQGTQLKKIQAPAANSGPSE